MIQNKNERKAGEGIWWKSPKHKNPQKGIRQTFESDASEYKTTGKRTVSRAEKEAWERAAYEAQLKVVFEEKVKQVLNEVLERIKPELLAAIKELEKKYRKEEKEW